MINYYALFVCFSLDKELFDLAVSVRGVLQGHFVYLNPLFSTFYSCLQPFLTRSPYSLLLGSVILIAKNPKTFNTNVSVSYYPLTNYLEDRGIG